MNLDTSTPETDTQSVLVSRPADVNHWFNVTAGCRHLHVRYTLGADTPQDAETAERLMVIMRAHAKTLRLLLEKSGEDWSTLTVIPEGKYYETDAAGHRQQVAKPFTVYLDGHPYEGEMVTDLRQVMEERQAALKSA